MLARYVVACLYVCVFATRRYCIKTAKLRMMQSSLHDSLETLVFVAKKDLNEIWTGTRNEL